MSPLGILHLKAVRGWPGSVATREQTVFTMQTATRTSQHEAWLHDGHVGGVVRSRNRRQYHCAASDRVCWSGEVLRVSRHPSVASSRMVAQPASASRTTLCGKRLSRGRPRAAQMCEGTRPLLMAHGAWGDFASILDTLFLHCVRLPVATRRSWACSATRRGHQPHCFPLPCRAAH